jgi:hypothetical protein
VLTRSRRRLGAGADQHPLRRRQRDGVGPQRRAPEVHAELQAMPLQLLDLVLARPRAGGSRPGGSIMRWAGNRSGRADLQGPRLSRAGLVLASKPIDVGVAAVLDGNGRRCARSRSATARRSAGRRRASRRSAAGRCSPS